MILPQLQLNLHFGDFVSMYSADFLALVPIRFPDRHVTDFGGYFLVLQGGG